MRCKRFPIFALFCISLSVGGCTAKSSHHDSVVGPDLSRTGPFTLAHEIILTGISHEESGNKVPPVRIVIERGAHEDVATLEHVISDTKSYLAGVTYHAFRPIVAETNAEQKDYWIVGLNLTRTPDRSIYTVLRYPHALKIEPGLTSDAFEYLSLACYDLDLAREKQYEIDTTDKAGKRIKQIIPLEAAPPAEAGACEFNSVQEALKVTPAIFQNYDRLKHESDTPKLSWLPLHAEVK